MAVNEPAVVFAANVGEVARPFASVVAVAWVPPPAKVALALEEVVVPQGLVPPDPSVKATVVPAIGLPPESSTLTCSGCG